MAKILFNWVLNVITWTIILKKNIYKEFFLLITLIRSVTKFCSIFFIHSKNVIFVFSSSGFRKCYSFYFWGLKLIQIWAQCSNSHRNDINFIIIYAWIYFSWRFVVHIYLFYLNLEGGSLLCQNSSRSWKCNILQTKE